MVLSMVRTCSWGLWVWLRQWFSWQKLCIHCTRQDSLIFDSLCISFRSFMESEKLFCFQELSIIFIFMVNLQLWRMWWASSFGSDPSLAKESSSSSTLILWSPGETVSLSSILLRKKQLHKTRRNKLQCQSHGSYLMSKKRLQQHTMELDRYWSFTCLTV